MAVTVAVLGTAVEGFSVTGAALAGDRMTLVSRNLAPTRVATLDVTSNTLVDQDTTIGAGAWGLTRQPDASVAIGLFGAKAQGNLLRYSGALTVLAALDANYIWSLAAAPDGRLYGVTSDRTLLFRYDPATQQANDLGGVQSGDQLRVVTVAAGRVIVGGARNGKALLYSVNLAGQDRRDILPPDLAGDRLVYALAASGNRLAVGTTGPGMSMPALALLDLADPAATKIVRLPREATIDCVLHAPGVIYGSARPSGGLYQLTIADGTLRRLAVPVPLSETRLLTLHGTDVLGANGTGEVYRYRTQTGNVQVVAPPDLGLPLRPELTQSLAADAKFAVVGGSFRAQVHDLVDGTSTSIRVPGEPKDVVLVGTTAYLALYPIAEVWALDLGTKELRRVAQLPSDQLRPIAMAHDPRLGSLVVTTTDDLSVGALHVVDPVTGRVSTTRNPLGNGQIPAGLAVEGATVYVGGSGTNPSVAQVDLVTGAVRWRLDAVTPDTGFVLGMARTGALLYALTTEGWAVAIDPAAPGVARRRRVAPDGGRLRALAGSIHAVATGALLRLDPTTLAPTTEVANLASAVWGWPSLALGPTGTRYTARGRTLIAAAGT